MKLWIANTTKQIHIFVYRPKLGGGKSEDGVMKPVFGEMRQQTIPLGGQICVGDLQDGEIRNILDQHKHIVDFKSLNSLRGFQGLCYRQGPDPMPVEKILERIDSNDEVRTEESKDRQARTALEIASRMRLVSQSDDAPFKDLRETDIQVAQKADKEVNRGTSQLNQLVEVPEEGKQPSGRGRRSA
jgi:hypothetical protein